MMPRLYRCCVPSCDAGSVWSSGFGASQAEGCRVPTSAHPRASHAGEHACTSGEVSSRHCTRVVAQLLHCTRDDPDHGSPTAHNALTRSSGRLSSPGILESSKCTREGGRSMPAAAQGSGGLAGKAAPAAKFAMVLVAGWAWQSWMDSHIHVTWYCNDKSCDAAISYAGFACTLHFLLIIIMMCGSNHRLRVPEGHLMRGQHRQRTNAEWLPIHACGLSSSHHLPCRNCSSLVLLPNTSQLQHQLQRSTHIAAEPRAPQGFGIAVID